MVIAQELQEVSGGDSLEHSHDETGRSAIQLLTWDTAPDLLVDADYVTLSVGVKPPAERFEISEREVNARRLEYLKKVFFDRLESILADGTAYGSSSAFGLSFFLKLSPSGPDDFERIEDTIAAGVPLWSYVGLSYCWTGETEQRASTLLYQLVDRMPPHPRTAAYAAQTGHSYDGSAAGLSQEEVDQYYDAEEAHLTYRESDDAPRFQYGPTHILNGARGAKGGDVVVHLRDHYEIDIRMDTEPADDAADSFPSTAGSTSHSRLAAAIESSELPVVTDRLDTPLSEVTTPEAPAPLCPATE